MKRLKPILHFRIQTRKQSEAKSESRDLVSYNKPVGADVRRLKSISTSVGKFR